MIQGYENKKQTNYQTKGSEVKNFDLFKASKASKPDPDLAKIADALTAEIQKLKKVSK